MILICKWQLEGILMYQSMSYLGFVCKTYKEFEVLYVDDWKPTWEYSVKVVDILNMCKILGCRCWFWMGYWF